MGKVPPSGMYMSGANMGIQFREMRSLPAQWFQEDLPSSSGFAATGSFISGSLTPGPVIDYDHGAVF